MTNEEFLLRVKNIACEKKGWTLYQLQKNLDENVIKESTFFSMFQKKSTPKLEYIAEISRTLGISQAELIEPESSKNHITPLQMRILSEFDGLEDEMIERLLPMVRGLIFAEKKH